MKRKTNKEEKNCDKLQETKLCIVVSYLNDNTQINAKLNCETAKQLTGNLEDHMDAV